MSYLGLDLDSLVWEIKSLMQNNYGCEVHKNNFETHFSRAKKDILEAFKDIIEQNKKQVFNEFEDEGVFE
jgi:hypothetical protein